MLNDVENRLLAKTRVIFGHEGDCTTDHESDNDSIEDVHGAEGASTFTKEFHREFSGEHDVYEEVACDGRQNNGTPVAAVQRRLHLGFLGVVADTNHLGSEDGEHNAEGRNHKRQQNRGHATEVVGDASTHVADDVVSEHHGRQNRGDIRAKQIGSHTRYVPDIVPDVVSDGCGVAGVVLRNACFHLADEVSSDIRGFGVNAATYAGKQRNAFCTE